MFEDEEFLVLRKLRDFRLWALGNGISPVLFRAALKFALKVDTFILRHFEQPYIEFVEKESSLIAKSWFKIATQDLRMQQEP